MIELTGVITLGTSAKSVEINFLLLMCMNFFCNLKSGGCRSLLNGQ